MDTEIINYETMLATQQSAKWAFWAMWGTWFSGGATLLAAFVALRALNTWKHQARHSELKSLKNALINYRNLAIYLPERIVPTNPNEFREAAIASQNAMNHIWAVVTEMEIDLSNPNEIGEAWLELFETHSKYMSGEINHYLVMDVLFRFIAIPIVNPVK